MNIVNDAAIDHLIQQCIGGFSQYDKKRNQVNYGIDITDYWRKKMDYSINQYFNNCVYRGKMICYKAIHTKTPFRQIKNLKILEENIGEYYCNIEAKKVSSMWYNIKITY